MGTACRLAPITAIPRMFMNEPWEPVAANGEQLTSGMYCADAANFGERGNPVRALFKCNSIAVKM